MLLDIKICGLKQPESVAAALTGGATHLGFIFFEKSPRHVTPQIAGALAASALGKAVSVAVTVDADDASLDAIVSGMHPKMLQLHGSETPQRVAAVKARFALPVMKALSIREAADLKRVSPYVGIADRFLFDAKPPVGAELPGGNGMSFDWSLLERLDRSIDYVLSGGINEGNVGEAILNTHASGIDVSSGVERAPGVKDQTLIAMFLGKVRRIEKQRAKAARKAG